jgi:molybdopterin-binding protein
LSFPEWQSVDGIDHADVPDIVSSETVILTQVSIGEQRITSIITARSAREMNLKAGQTAAALIKSTEVMILRV